MVCLAGFGETAGIQIDPQHVVAPQGNTVIRTPQSSVVAPPGSSVIYNGASTVVAPPGSSILSEGGRNVIVSPGSRGELAAGKESVEPGAPPNIASELASNVVDAPPDVLEPGFYGCVVVGYEENRIYYRLTFSPLTAGQYRMLHPGFGNSRYGNDWVCKAEVKSDEWRTICRDPRPQERRGSAIESRDYIQVLDSEHFQIMYPYLLQRPAQDSATEDCELWKGEGTPESWVD